MSHHPAYRLLPPTDEEAPRRAGRLRELGIREAPDPEFDEFARQLATETGAYAAMVNFIWPHGQYFAGLHPSSSDRGVDPENDSMRTMACDHGYCMYVAVRRHAMALDEVMDYHIFAGNPVVDEIGVRAYLGAPLIDRDGMLLGTICVVDTKPHDWGQEGLEYIKARAAELTDRIRARSASANGSGCAPGAGSKAGT
jgi:GAF domain-containing protein